MFSNDLAAEALDSLSHVTLREASRFALLNPVRQALSTSNVHQLLSPISRIPLTIGNALKIRQIAYFSRESMAIVGNETLGIPRVEDKRFPIYKQILVPSMLDFQIDTLAIKLMHEALKRIIKRLKTVFFGKKSEQRWYEAYITSFVLLDTLMTVFKLQLSYQECEHGGRFCIPSLLIALSGRPGAPSTDHFSQEENTLANVSYITISMTKE